MNVTKGVAYLSDRYALPTPQLRFFVPLRGTKGQLMDFLFQVSMLLRTKAFASVSFENLKIQALCI